MSIRLVQGLIVLAVVAGMTALWLPRGAAQEATPVAGASLTSYVWELRDLSGEVPDDSSGYTVTFLADGTLLIHADCNQGRGTYTADGEALSAMVGATTLALCPPESLSDAFLTAIGQAATFQLDGEGGLMIALADGGSMTMAPSLTGVVWQWTRFQGGDGAETIPDDPSRYTIEFMAGGEVAVRADCNRGRGTYARTDSDLDITVLALTRAACPPESLSDTYLGYLDEASSLVFADGQLHLALPMDSGILSFSPVFPEV